MRKKILFFILAGLCCSGVRAQGRQESQIRDVELRATFCDKELIARETHAQYDGVLYTPQIDGRIYITDAEGACVVVVKKWGAHLILDDDSELLDHVNRNRCNARPAGNLTLIGKSTEVGPLLDAVQVEGWYRDGQGCVWKLYKKYASAYHNPDANYKLGHTDERGGEHEIVVTAPDGVRAELPRTIGVNDRTIVRDDPAEGTYNYGRNLIEHVALDIAPHEEGYRVYMNFGDYPPAVQTDADKAFLQQYLPDVPVNFAVR